MSGSQKATTQTTQQQSSQTNPWAPQAQQIQQAWGYANDAYGKASQAQGPSDFVAQFTPEQMSNFNRMIGYGGNTSLASSPGSQLSQAGSSAATGALSDLAGFNPSDPTQQNIANATAYASNPAVDGMVDASMRDARRQVSEQALPGIAQNAALTGNVNSSRRALAEGMVERGLADKAADVSSNLRGNMFQNGLSLAQGDNQFNQSAVLDAMKARLAGGTSAASTGAATAGQDIQNQGALFDIANAGASGLRGSTQADLDNQSAKYSFNSTSPYDAVNQLWQIIGSGNWGSQSSGTSTGTSETKTTPSAWQVAGGLMGAGGSLLNSMPWLKASLSK